MRMTTKELNRQIPLCRTNSREEYFVLIRADINVTENNDEVQIFILESLLEPSFFDRILHSLNHGVVCISSEVEDETKCQNANALILGGKLLVSLRQGLQFSSFRIVDIEI